jgi:eukaryotic-like serine/threonine-protein kinase
LAHPNIVKVYEFGESAGTPYLVMEYIQGHDLAEHLRQAGQVPLEETSTILNQIAAALDYAHAQGLVHRDIKASNVMLEENEAGRRAVLMDFGIAKLVGGTALTNTGMLGTFEYMSPEQIQASANVDGRADVYSLGVLAFQMLTGQLPFTATSPAAILIAHLQTPPPDPGLFQPDLPPLASAAIIRALEKDPVRRFPTAGAFASALYNP